MTLHTSYRAIKKQQKRLLPHAHYFIKVEYSIEPPPFIHTIE